MNHVIPIDKPCVTSLTDISEIAGLLREDATLRPNTAITTQPSVHEQLDGTILAICVTGDHGTKT